MTTRYHEEDLPTTPDALSIFVLGIMGFFSFGVLGIAAYLLGRKYKKQLARGRIRRNRLADAGFVLGTIGFMIFLAFAAFILLAVTGVFVAIELFF